MGLYGAWTIDITLKPEHAHRVAQVEALLAKHDLYFDLWDAEQEDGSVSITGHEDGKVGGSVEDLPRLLVTLADWVSQGQAGLTIEGDGYQGWVLKHGEVFPQWEEVTYVSGSKPLEGLTPLEAPVTFRYEERGQVRVSADGVRADVLAALLPEEGDHPYDDSLTYALHVEALPESDTVTLTVDASGVVTYDDYADYLVDYVDNETAYVTAWVEGVVRGALSRLKFDLTVDIIDRNVEVL